MDKLASQFLHKAPSSIADNFHLDYDSDLDSDDEERWRPPPVKPVEVVKYESLDRDKVLRHYKETLGRLCLVRKLICVVFIVSAIPLVGWLLNIMMLLNLKFRVVLVRPGLTTDFI